MFWHGSPALIQRPYLLPGEILGIDRFKNKRNKTVFCSDDIRTAADMGSPQGAELEYDSPLRNYRSAPYMYLVEPNDVYPRSTTKPYAHFLEREVMCKTAVVLAAYKARDEEVPKPVSYSALLATYIEFSLSLLSSP